MHATGECIFQKCKTEYIQVVLFWSYLLTCSTYMQKQPKCWEEKHDYCLPVSSADLVFWTLLLIASVSTLPRTHPWYCRISLIFLPCNLFCLWCSIEIKERTCIILSDLSWKDHLLSIEWNVPHDCWNLTALPAYCTYSTCSNCCKPLLHTLIGGFVCNHCLLGWACIVDSRWHDKSVRSTNHLHA